MGMAGARQVQKVTGIHKYYKFRSLYIIQDNRYRILVNVIITGEVLT